MYSQTFRIKQLMIFHNVSRNTHNIFVKCVYLQVLEYFRETEQVIDDL